MQVLKEIVEVLAVLVVLAAVYGLGGYMTERRIEREERKRWR